MTDTGATTVQQQVNQTFVAVASEAVSRLLDETVFEVSQNLSKTNRKAAANVHEAAQRMQEQEKTLQRVARLTETGQDILADTERALQKSKRAAASSASTLTQSIDTLTEVRQAIRAFSIRIDGVLTRADAQLTQAGITADEQITQLQAQITSAEARVNRLIYAVQTIIEQNENTLTKLKNVNETYPSKALTDAITVLETQNQQYRDLLQSLQQTAATLQNASARLADAQQSIGGLERFQNHLNRGGACTAASDLGRSGDAGRRAFRYAFFAGADHRTAADHSGGTEQLYGRDAGRAHRDG